jgi:hypothetical protein
VVAVRLLLMLLLELAVLVGEVTQEHLALELALLD